VKRRVLLLGSTGLLGSKTSSILAENSDIELITTSRTGQKSTLKFNPLSNNIKLLLDETRPDFVVNCIGVIPQDRVRNIKNYIEMFKINASFARKLARAARVREIVVIQPQSDAVFSGRRGCYSETSSRRPRSMYGLSKLFGETKFEGQIKLRCSIIGPEISGNSKSIFSWALSKPLNSEISGFTNHFWNGVTTSIFGRVCEYLILGSPKIPSTLHLVPNDSVTKFELLRLIAKYNSRSDLKILPSVNKGMRDLRLTSNYKDYNILLWRGIGFTSSPTIEEMLALD
jgi:dTDP-4-dehydrorhamnose reductase